MPTNPEHVHQCAYLAYQERQVELVYPGDERFQRWSFFDADGNVLVQVVFYCPYCGRDFRADCWWQISGRPEENAILAGAREAQRIGELMMAPGVVEPIDLSDEPILHPSPRVRAGRYELLSDEDSES